jgi:flagellar basal-body rod protein FlgF
MESALHVAVAGQQSLNKQLTVVAHNIANSGTAGFRAEIVDFKSLVSRTPDEDVHFAKMAKLYPNVQQGTLEQTENPLDVALTGEGWFAIDTPAGTAYTRDGRFVINALGELKTLEGHSVLDAGQAPIQLNANAGPPEIAQDGRITSNGQTVANLGVFQIAADDMVSRYSNSAFLSKVPAEPVVVGGDVSINQGFVEGSNVNALNEIANLIMITKTYESVSALVGKVDETLTGAVRKLAET